MASKLGKMSTNNVIALSSLVSLLMLVALILVGRGLFKQITHNTRVISKQQAAETQLKNNLSALPALAAAYQNLGNSVPLISDALPTTADFPALVAMMESVGGTSGVSITGVSPADATASTPTSGTSVSAAVGSSASPTPSSFSFSVTANGKYSSILQFLTNLQKSARPITVTGLQLSGTSDALTATISATTYYFNPPALIDKTETVK